ncbi:PKD domain-containing protein, partial [Aureicoccus marinus]
MNQQFLNPIARSMVQVVKKNLLLYGLLLAFGFYQANAQVNFDQSTLNFNGIGESTNGFTSIMFGPDGRLYVAEYHGLIKIFTIERQSSTSYTVTAVEELNGIQTMEDHNDDGSGFSSLERETTGLTVAGTATNPIIYVTSSDFRIGSGPAGGNGDVGLDTNSGVITRFTWTGSAWDVVDLVRGLPRSEENHATNGLEYAQINGVNYLLVTSGGITNAGSPSTNFVFTCEYALSGAILSVNLDEINSLPILTDSGRQYIYDLPTLDDPTRPNSNGIIDPNDPGYTGEDLNDPWGGNDGLNMAIIDPAGPVQVFSPGFRNAYDLVVTESGAVYATDNGANGGWGGFPVNEGTVNANNDYDPNETGSTFATQAPDGERILNQDHLELITTDLSSYTFGSYYAGHPNPVRANPSGAGLYTVNDTNSVWRTLIYDPDGSSPNSTTDVTLGLPANWPPVNTANPDEGDWRGPTTPNPDGPDNSPVLVWGTNTNGIDEYTATNFAGQMQGNLIAGVNSGVLRRVELNPDGSVANFTAEFFSGLGGNALAITCNSDTEIFPGTIWAGTLGGDLIVFEPQDFVVCILPGEMDYDPSADNDSDGYTNDDEDQNGTDLCNGGSQPSDFDKAAGGILVSDLLDNDDDFDGIVDSADPFQLGDPTTSGSDAFPIPVSNDLFNDQQQLGGIFGLGMTGLMNNGDTNENWINWLDRRDDPTDPNPNDVLGGAPGLMTSHMTSGTALGVTNTQEKGYQYGVQSEASVGSYSVVGGMVGFTGGLRLYGNTAAVGGELGFFIGDGTQSNYIKFTVNVDGFEMIQEINDIPQAPITSTLLESDRPATTGGIRFYFLIEPSTGDVTCQYSIDGGAKVTVGTITAQGTILEAIQQSTKDLAVGLIGTSGVSGVELEGTWDFLNVLFEEPFVVQSIPDIERPLGETQEILDLSNYFDDNDGVANLTYSVQNNTNANFTPVITSSQLDIALPNLIESTDLTIRAIDQGGFFVDETFTISINNGPIVLYRVNAGGPEVTAIDGLLNWDEDTDLSPSIYLNEAASNRVFSGSVNALDPSVNVGSVPLGLFTTERFDDSAGTPNMSYAFPVAMSGNYEIRLYMGEGFIADSQIGQRIFDVQIEGITLPLLNDIDLAESFGSFNGGVFSHIIKVNDSEINIEFIHGVIENPMVNAIEILDVPDFDTPIYLKQIADQINEPGTQINNGLAVQAFGGDGNLSYDALNLPPGLTIEPTNGLFTGTIALNAADNSPYLVTINVEDSDGFNDDGASIQFLWNINDTSDFRINAGGISFNTPNLGANWEDNATEGAQVGNGFTVNTGRVDPITIDFANRDQASMPAYIDQTAFDMLFAQERYDIASGDDMAYEIPIANGSFVVNLYFANFFEGTNQIGDRVFDILLEGAVSRDNFDIVQEFGHLTGGMISLPVDVVDGVLDIGFGRVTQNPLINAIEIYRIDSALDPVVLNNPGNQLNDVNNFISLQINATGGDVMESFVYFALGLPEGLSIDPNTGEISGTIAESASTGGPANDGQHPVKVTVLKEGSAPSSIEFIWEIASSWTEKDEDLNYSARHECSFVQAGDKFYLMGGRESATNIDIYDYSSNTWQTLSNSAPFEFNHYQAVTYQGYIWIIGAFKDNNFPTEAPAEYIWLFDPVNQNWIQGPEIPTARRRGSAGLVMYNDKFYVVAGNTVGHDGGAVPYLDEYDPKTGTWTVLADAPRARDHFGAVLIDDKIYVASGRTSGGTGGVFAPVIPEVDVYNITNATWSTLPAEDNIPTPRAGTAVANFNNRLVVIGGEVKNELVYGVVVNDALKITEQYDPATESWTRLPDMNFERHGTQAIVSGDGIYVLAGSPSRGGGNQKNMEFFGTDNANGAALQGSVIEAPAGVFVADNSTSSFQISIVNGNTGTWIDRMEITGVNAADYSISTGELTSVLLKQDDLHTIEVNLTGTGEGRNAVLTIYYGLNDSVAINLSNNDVPPIVTNPGNQTNTEGDSVSLQIDATDNGVSLTYEATNLPPTLTIDENSGLITGTIEVANQGDKIFQEENGYLLIEAESANLVGGWSLTTVGGAVGITPDSQHFGNPLGGGQLTYKINITNTGVYRFNWRNLYTGNLAAENNDSWLKFPNDSNVVFFGYDGFTTSNESIYTNIIENDIYDDLCYPKGSGLGNNITTDMGGTLPLGLGSNGYFKVYRTGGQPEVYEWESKVSDGDDHSVFVWFKNPGVYEFIVSERSSGHIIDKMVLYKVTQAGDFNTEAKLDALPESNFTGSSGGAADNSPYNVQVTVTDDSDLSDTVDFTWFVGSLGQSLFAVAESDITTGNSPLSVNFVGSNSFDDIAVTGYLWDFQDGNTSTEANPTYVFNSSGTYEVSLTVIDGDGNTDTDILTIEVQEPLPPTSVAETNITAGNAPLEVSFTGSNSFDDKPNNIISYAWDFGTGDTSVEQDPTYTFLSGGVYTVSLTVEDGQGLTDTATLEITVNGAPVAIATADVTSGNEALEVNFTGSGSTDDNNDIVSYAWDFGTGDMSTEANPTYTFTTGGVYTVSLTV